MMSQPQQPHPTAFSLANCYASRYCEEKFISKYIPTIGIDYGVKPVKLGRHEVRRRPLPTAASQLARSHGVLTSARFLSSIPQVRVNLWDLAGSPDYLEVRNEFYKDSQAALLVRACIELCMRLLVKADPAGVQACLPAVIQRTRPRLPVLLLLQVFDVTNRPSFESLSSWMAEAAKYAAPSSMVSREALQLRAHPWQAAPCQVSQSVSRTRCQLQMTAAKGSGTCPHCGAASRQLVHRSCLSAFAYTQAVYVVANKVDLPGRRVTELEGREWAASRGYPYVEVRGMRQQPACRRAVPFGEAAAACRTSWSADCGRLLQTARTLFLVPFAALSGLGCLWQGRAAAVHVPVQHIAGPAAADGLRLGAMRRPGGSSSMSSRGHGTAAAQLASLRAGRALLREPH